MKERKFCVYAHISPSGKYYIGQTCQDVNERWRKGAGYHSEKFNAQIIAEEGGWNNFQHIILEDNINETDIDDREAFYINKYNSVDKGFNTYERNYNGYHFSTLWSQEETRNKIIKTLTEQRNTEEYHEQQSLMMKNLWQTDSYRESQKESWTDERRAKTSENVKKSWEDPDRRMRMLKGVSSEAQKARWQTEEYRRKQCKAVRCVETGEIFDSLVKAAEYAGVKANTICAALSSKTHKSGKHPESGQPLHWERYTYPDGVGEEGSHRREK